MLLALQEALGVGGVVTDPALAERSLADWSGTPSALPPALLEPSTPAQVAQALRLCADAGQPVAVPGGLTGPAGGVNPQAGEVGLSLARLDTIWICAKGCASCCRRSGPSPPST